MAGYAIGLQAVGAANLTISELTYHPAGPTPEEVAAGFNDPDNFEFIELRNTGDSRVNLWDARFTEGIDFTFPVTLAPPLAGLEPGETVLLVSVADDRLSRK